jgi:hypothetical protein
VLSDQVYTTASFYPKKERPRTQDRIQEPYQCFEKARIFWSLSEIKDLLLPIKPQPSHYTATANPNAVPQHVRGYRGMEVRREPQEQGKSPVRFRIYHKVSSYGDSDLIPTNWKLLL